MENITAYGGRFCTAAEKETVSRKWRAILLDEAMPASNTAEGDALKLPLSGNYLLGYGIYAASAADMTLSVAILANGNAMPEFYISREVKAGQPFQLHDLGIYTLLAGTELELATRADTKGELVFPPGKNAYLTYLYLGQA